MRTIKVGAREIKLDAAEDPAMAQAAVDMAMKDAAMPLQAKLEALGATMQQMAAQLAELTTALAEEEAMEAAAGAPAPSPEAVMNARKARRAKLAAEALHADARAILGAGAKLDGKDVATIQREAVAHAVGPAIKLDALDAKTLDGMFAVAVAHAKKAKPAVAPRNDALAGAGAAASPAPEAVSPDPDAAMAKARDARRDAARKAAL